MQAGGGLLLLDLVDSDVVDDRTVILAVAIGRWTCQIPVEAASDGGQWEDDSTDEGKARKSNRRCSSGQVTVVL